MDVLVHRMRHLHYHPRSIVAMCCQGDLLAISRENGSIEIRSVSQKLRTLCTVSGSASRVLSVMAWTKEDVLVGASADGTISIVDFHAQKMTASTASGGGGVFCMIPIGNNEIAVGCEDGTVRFFVVDACSLQMSIIIPSMGAPVLSMACRELEGKIVLFAGVADGTIRRFDRGSSSFQSTFRMTVESQGRNVATRVWDLQVLSDATVVSTDSLGHVQMWNGHTGTLAQTFDQNDNKADVLCCESSEDETKIFASGVDSRVVCIERGEDGVWVMSKALRPHTHDVKALVLTNRRRTIRLSDGSQVQKDKELLLSGGVDTKLCVYNTAQFAGKKRPKVLYPWPTKTPVSLARDAGIVAMLRDDRVDLYRLHGQTGPKEALVEPLLVAEDETLIGSVQIRTPRNLSCASISSDAKFLAMADSKSLHLFQLSLDKRGAFTPSKLSLDLPSMPGIAAIQFSGANVLNIAFSSGSFRSISLPSGDDDDVLSTEVPCPQDASDQKLLPTHDVQCSQDGKWIATLRNGLGVPDAVDVYHFTEGSLRHWWRLPSLEIPVTAFGFKEGNESHRLVIGAITFAPYIFDVAKRTLDPWSDAAGFPVDKSIPSELLHRHDFPVRVSCNPKSPSSILLVRATRFVEAHGREVIPLGVKSRDELGCHPCKTNALGARTLSKVIHSSRLLVCF